MSNIKPFGIAEPFDKYVRDQIRIRQEKKAAGFGDKSRTPEELSYLTSQNSWIRCASSTKVTDKKRLTDMGFSDPQANSLTGQNLAKEFVLFNGTTKDGQYTDSRAGLFNDANQNPLYGVGGLDFGQVPMPGIKSFDVSHITNGALRQATLTLSANNRVQYNIIDALYIRLGHTIFVEWGNNLYFDNNNDFQSNTSAKSLIEDGTWFNPASSGIDLSNDPFLQFAEKITEKKQSFSGNYDAFLGKVTNFQVNFTPEGIYEIQISMVSTGDVAEGLKVNNLTVANTIPESSTENPDLLIKSQYNQSDLKNYLYALTEVVNTEKDQFNKVNDVTQKIDYVNLSIQRYLASFVKKPDLQYIRLGKLLSFIEDYIVPKNNKIPIIKIDEGSESFIRIFPGLISTDPSKCVINNDNFVKGFNDRNNELFSNFEIINTVEDEAKGRIGDIYLKITHIESILDSLVGDTYETEVSLIQFLDRICQSLNSCFGGFIDIQPAIDDESQTVYLRDTLFHKKLEDIKEEKSPQDEVEKDTGLIKIYGYTPSGENITTENASIVKQFDLKTEIASDLAAQLSIGAAASNLSTSNTNPFFKAISYGLQDIYQEGIVTDGLVEDSTEKKDTFFYEYLDSEGKKRNIELANVDQPQTGVVGAGTTEDLNQSEDTDSEKKQKEEDKNKAKEVKDQAKADYLEYVSKMLDVRGVSAQHRYFRFMESDAKRGSSKLKSYLNSVYNLSKKVSETKSKTGGANLINFIPIKLSLEIDGISGIKIYNRLSVDTEFLPVNYPEVLDFVILGISHRLIDNDWTTIIETLSIPTRESQEETEKILREENPEDQNNKKPTDSGEDNPDIVFFAPTGDLPLTLRNPQNAPTRDDSKGEGWFGASRGNRTHTGIDIKTIVPPGTLDIFKEYPYLNGRQVVAGLLPGQKIFSGKGTPVFAPIAGILRPTSAFADSVLPGVKIEGQGDYEGYVVKIFYLAPIKSLYNQAVTLGQSIGDAVKLNLQPAYQGVSDHIHFAVQYKGEYIDPSDLEYTISPSIQSRQAVSTVLELTV